MTSQVSNTRVSPANELLVDDVIYGASGQIWGAKWLVRDGPREYNNDYIEYTLSCLSYGREGEKTSWLIGKFTEIMVENKTFKYDPKQAGDTEEDV